jgi:hypothetical protein
MELNIFSNVRKVFNEFLDDGDEFTAADLATVADVGIRSIYSYLASAKAKHCCIRINPNERGRNATGKYRKLKNEVLTRHPKSSCSKNNHLNLTTQKAVSVDKTYSVEYKPIDTDSITIATQIVELINLLKKENATLFAKNKQLVAVKADILNHNQELIKQVDDLTALVTKYQLEVNKLKRSSEFKFVI